MSKETYLVTSSNLIPMCIVRVLENYSDENHPLTQEQIIAYLKNDYGVEKLERKAVGRAISRLEDELGYEFGKSTKGVWLSRRTFDNAELQMLIDSVFSSRFVSAKYSKDLIEKLLSLGNRYFKNNVKYVCSMDNLSKDPGAELFLTIETINAAIEEKRQIKFDYWKYGSDMEPHIKSHHVASPYRLVMHGGEYYLMMYHEWFKEIIFYKVGRMKNLKMLEEKVATPLKSLPGWEQGIRNDTFVKRPYLFSDKAEHIEFLVTMDAFDYVISQLGRDILVEKVAKENDKVKISVTSSPHAMQYFAQQYAEHVEILSPQHLRDDVIVALKKSLQTYENKEQTEAGVNHQG